MTGFRALLLKEWLEAWRSRRIVAVVILFAILGIMSALTARYLPEILKAALGDQLTIPVPTPVAADVVLQLQKNLGQIGALVAIVLAIGAVATEKERGTAAFVLTKPVSRWAFLGAKLVVLGSVLGLATLAAVATAWVYAAILFEPGPVLGWLALAVLVWLALATWASITFLASTVSGSAAVAAGVGVVALIAVSLVAAIPQAGRLLPAGLDAPGRALATGGSVDAGLLATAVGGSVVLVVGSAILAGFSFRRQEL